VSSGASARVEGAPFSSYLGPDAIAYGGLLRRILSQSNAEYAFTGDVLSDSGFSWRAHAMASGRGVVSFERRSLAREEIEVLLGEIAGHRPSDVWHAWLPHDAPDLRTLLVVPFFGVAGELLGVVGIANRQPDFDPYVVASLQPVFATLAAMMLSRSSIAEARSSWRDTFDAVEQPVVALDGAARIVRLNRVARDLLNRSFLEAIGLPLSELADDEPWATAAPLAGRAIVERLPGEARAHDANDGRIWTVSATPNNAAGARAILVMRDITDTIQLEESRRQVETMAALGRTMAGVAHEVRNPLFGISSTLDAFEARFGRGSDQATFFGVLRTELNRLTTLMEDLLDYGRPAVLQCALADVPSLVDDAIKHCAEAAFRSGVSIRHQALCPMRPLSVDGRRVTEVFINVLENAIQHSPKGGAIEVHHAEEIDPSGLVWQVISIEDTGPGFDTNDLEHVFEPFFTRRRGGTGLGLSIVQRIIQQHRGQVEAANGLRGGGRVTVRLPVDLERGRSSREHGR
jgi:signal transduction histidine kinase